MKIFLSFLQGKPNHPIPAYSFWEFYIKNGITESKNNWTELPQADWAKGLVQQSKYELQAWKEQIWQETLDFLKNNPVDLFLSYLYPQQVDEQAIKEIQKLGIPCVNFFCDNVREYKEIPSEFSVFDLNWVPEYKALQLYKKAGYKYIHLPMPMWVEPKHRIIKSAEINRISFIGSHDIQRQLLFEEVLKKSSDLPLDIYGSGWLNENTDKLITEKEIYTFTDKLNFQYQFIKTLGIATYLRKIEQRNYKPQFSTTLSAHLKGKPNFENYIQLSQESMITLGVNRYPSFRFPLNKPDTYSRLRDIEAPMLAACYLTEWTDGLDEMYELGKEIEVYKNIDELVVKSDLLIKNKNKRNKLKQNGQHAALNNHSIGNSLKKIFLRIN